MKKSVHRKQKNSHVKKTTSPLWRGLVQFFFMIPVVLFVFVPASFLSTQQAHAAAGLNRTINFQGRVVNKSDGTNVTNGTYTFLFKIYDSSAGGTELWGGTGESQSLTVTNGVFQAALGSVRSFATDNLDFNQDNLWLDITFNGENFGSRVRLAAVPQAFLSEKTVGLTVASGKTLTANNSITIAGTDSKTLTVSDSTTLGTNAITLGGGEVITFTAANAVTFTTTGTTSVTLPTSGTLLSTTGGQTVSGALTLSTNSSTALSVGANGATNPALLVDDSTASSATGIKIKSAAAAGGVALSVISSGTNENLTIDAKGSGTTTINGTATGGITLGALTTLASGKALIITGGSGDPTATAGTVWYDSTAGKFKIVEGTTVKVLCNTTDAGCGAGGSGARLDQVTAANTTATIANGDNAVIWNWAPSTAGRTDFTFGATSAPASGTNTALAVSLTHTSNTETNGFLVNANGSGGTTTNGIQISQTAGTLTNGLLFSGTIGTEINLGTIASGSTGISGTLSNTTAANVTGISWTTGTITTSGTQNAESLTLTAIGAGTTNGILITPPTTTTSGGTINGINIGSITTSNGGDTGITIGTGWDTGIIVGSGKAVLGTASSATGNLVFNNSTNANTVTIQSGVTSSSYTWTLPTADASGCLQSNGSGTLSISACGDTNIQTFTANGNYTVPSNALMVIVEAWGAGGGGGGGTGGSTAAVRSGGAGGGGGSYDTTTLQASTLGTSGTTVPITVGVAGTAGTAGNGAVGGVGGAGNPSCLSSTTNCAGTIYLEAFGGAGGNGAGTAGNGGGGGGGTQSVGTTNGTAATGGTGGNPLGAAAGANNSGSGGGGGATAAATGAAGGSSNWGGGGGGSSSSTGAGNSGAGGGSNQGGAGGGAGGTCAITTCTQRSGGAGGHVPGLSGGGGTAGSTAGAAGGAGAAGQGSGGDGGGGGANNPGGTGGTGGTGGSRGGGGGGGGAGETTLGGAGGAGGTGYVRVWTLRGTGADLAEIYGTRDESITPGDVISLDFTMQAGVQKSTTQYDPTAIGVVSTQPGMVIGTDQDPGSKPVLVALAGRVPVKVTLENGAIHKGDLLTASSTPGYAMKADKAGQIIGQAMTDYTDPTAPGYVVAFLKMDHFGGTLANVLPSGLSGDTNSQTILSQLVASSSTTSASQAASVIFADTLAANKEVISPKITADEIFARTIHADQIEGLEILTNKLSALDTQVHQLQNPVVSSSLAASESADLVSPFATMSAVLGTATTSGQLTLDSIAVNGLATVSADLRVKGSGFIEGILTVIDTLTTHNLIVTGVSDFFKKTIFHSDVDIAGHISVGPDTSGNAIIYKGSKSVSIQFKTPYTTVPIPTASMIVYDGQDAQSILAQNYSYVIVNVTTTGFTILLSKPAIDDLHFNWQAVASTMMPILPSPTPTGIPDVSLTPIPSDIPITTPAPPQGSQ